MDIPNMKITLMGTKESETDQHEIECYCTKKNDILISIESMGMQYICLDKSTAVQLVKILKREISKIA